MLLIIILCLIKVSNSNFRSKIYSVSIIHSEPQTESHLLLVHIPMQSSGVTCALLCLLQIISRGFLKELHSQRSLWNCNHDNKPLGYIEKLKLEGQSEHVSKISSTQNDVNLMYSPIPLFLPLICFLGRNEERCIISVLMEPCHPGRKDMAKR